MKFLSKLKKSNVLIPYVIIFFFFFFPLIVYEMEEFEKIERKKISELEYKSYLLDEEYKELKKLVLKYGVYDFFVNETNKTKD